jgi:glycine/D-amino acid oxidase-like deaminating enzyme
VLSTDGLTESRDESGKLLEAEGAMQWIRQAPVDPSLLAARLIESARARSGNRMRDDVAVLAIRVARPSTIAHADGTAETQVPAEHGAPADA